MKARIPAGRFAIHGGGSPAGGGGAETFGLSPSRTNADMNWPVGSSSSRSYSSQTARSADRGFGRKAPRAWHLVGFELGEQDHVVQRQHERRVAHLSEGDLAANRLRCPMARVKRPDAEPWEVIAEGTASASVSRGSPR